MTVFLIDTLIRLFSNRLGLSLGLGLGPCCFKHTISRIPATGLLQQNPSLCWPYSTTPTSEEYPLPPHDICRCIPYDVHYY